jgi:hypothetical protein
MKLEITTDLGRSEKEVASFEQAAIIARKIGSGRCVLADDAGMEYLFAANGFGHGDWILKTEVEAANAK